MSKRTIRNLLNVASTAVIGAASVVAILDRDWLFATLTGILCVLFAGSAANAWTRPVGGGPRA